MIALAFKVAAESNSLFSKLIAWKTGGKYSHVEGWLSGPIEHAFCFSSREPKGTGYATIDLSNPKLWDIVPLQLTDVEEKLVLVFCSGTDQKDYDWLGILGFVWPWGEHDDHDRFCSEYWTECLQKALGWLPGLKAWMTDPSELRDVVLKGDPARGK